MIYNIFGSETSQDYDVMVYVSFIPPIQQCKELCARFENKLKYELPEKKLNVNLAVVVNGKIVYVFKGTPDECNNAIFATYHFHQQKHPLQITTVMDRNVPLKLARGLRIMLSFLSRTEHRPLVKAALKGTTEDKLLALESIDFAGISDLGKNNQDVVEFYKHAAFQIGQCLGLLEGVELYAKKDIKTRYVQLCSYLDRVPQEGSDLNTYKSRLIETIRSTCDLDSVSET